MNKRVIYIGSDHAGFELKQSFIKALETENVVIDKGTYSSESTDYPEYAHEVAQAVVENESSVGVLICGSANGVCMTANKHGEIRAAIAWKPEIADLARRHNNANVLCVPARYVSDEEGIEILTTFLGAEFEGGRHERRINKISIC